MGGGTVDVVVVVEDGELVLVGDGRVEAEVVVTRTVLDKRDEARPCQG